MDNLTLARARQLGVELSAATDKLNASIEAAERTLKELRLGVFAALPLDDDVPDECIGFGKEDSKWRLLYIIMDKDGEVVSSQPLVNASRAIRVRASRLLGQLLQEMIKNAEIALQETQAAVQTVEDFIKALQR